MEEVGIDNIDYKDVAQFEAFENFLKDPESDNIEEEPRCVLNYIELKDTSENRMLNDKIVQCKKMLKKQFVEANGLQDPVLGQGLKSIGVFHLFKHSTMVGCTG